MLMRFDPLREFDRLTQEGAPQRARSFPMDAYRRGDQFIVHFDLPGVDPASIDLTTEQNVLTVRAERRFETQEGDEVIVSERPQGTYTRQLLLGDGLDAEQIEAQYEGGVLSVAIPVAERAKPRRIEVTRSGDGARTIEGTARGDQEG